VIIHAGDLTSLPFLRELEALGPPVAAVHGNMDEPAVRDLLPETLVIEAGRALFGIVHDAGPRAGREARLAKRFADCEAAVYGHTHVAQVEKYGNFWVLNPGSPTERRRSPARSMLLVRAHGGVLEPELVELP
jgi:uncharacterized protein